MQPQHYCLRDVRSYAAWKEEYDGSRDAPIDVSEVEQAVAGPSAGAIVSFTGTVRDRTGPHQVEALAAEHVRGICQPRPYQELE